MTFVQLIKFLFLLQIKKMSASFCFPLSTVCNVLRCEYNLSEEEVDRVWSLGEKGGLSLTIRGKTFMSYRSGDGDEPDQWYIDVHDKAGGIIFARFHSDE